MPRWLAVAFMVGALALAAATRRRPGLAAGGVVVATLLLSMVIHVWLLDSGPVAQLASEHRTVTITGTLTEDPQWSERTGFGSGSQPQVRVLVRVTEVVTAVEVWHVRTPVVVIGEAAGWDDAQFGASVTVRGQLEQAHGIAPVGAMFFTRGPPTVLSQPARVLRGAERMRDGLRRAVSGLGPDARGLLPALVEGDTSDLDPTLVADLRSSGLSHLTAVSGANVAIVLIAVLLLARLVRVRGYAIPVVGLLAVGWFVLLARPQPSVLRAAVMGALGVVAVMAAGQRQGPRLLLAAVLVLLLVDPWLARSWGFALSVAATAGLLLLARRISGRMPDRWPRWLADAVGVAVAAQLATLPLSVGLSGQVAVLSVPANLLADPAVPPATVLGALAAAVSPVAPWLAEVFAWLGQWPTWWIAHVARSTSSAPLATIAWPEGWLGGATTFVAIAAGAVVVSVVRRRRWLVGRRGWAAALVLVVLAAAVIRGPARWPPGGWLLVACDVGQGDALVVATAPGEAIVVDAGPDPRLADQCLDELGVERIPLLVLTHDHADHVMGVPGVLDGRTVGAILASPLAEPEEQVADLARWTQGIPAAIATVGQSGVVGSVGWTVLWPARVIRGEGSDPNNASVVLMVSTGGFRILLTGDVEPAAQQALLMSGVDLAADIIKVPHHGSQYQDPAFWQAVSPKVAVVSVGVDNTYGHPSAGLLDALTAAGVLVGRTDRQGSVAVVSDNGELRLVTQH